MDYRQKTYSLSLIQKERPRIVSGRKGKCKNSTGEIIRLAISGRPEKAKIRTYSAFICLNASTILL